MQLPSTSWSCDLSQSTASGYVSFFGRTDSHSHITRSTPLPSPPSLHNSCLYDIPPVFFSATISKRQTGLGSFTSTLYGGRTLLCCLQGVRIQFGRWSMRFLSASLSHQLSMQLVSTDEAVYFVNVIYVAFMGWPSCPAFSLSLSPPSLSLCFCGGLWSLLSVPGHPILLPSLNQSTALFTTWRGHTATLPNLLHLHSPKIESPDASVDKPAFGPLCGKLDLQPIAWNWKLIAMWRCFLNYKPVAKWLSPPFPKSTKY